MILTISEIFDLASFAGLEMTKSITNDELETELTIIEKNGDKYAYFTEYPDEGCYPLGDAPQETDE